MRGTTQRGRRAMVQVAVGADQPDTSSPVRPVQERHPLAAGMEVREGELPRHRARSRAVVVTDAGTQEHGIAHGHQQVAGSTADAARARDRVAPGGDEVVVSETEDGGACGEGWVPAGPH